MDKDALRYIRKVKIGNGLHMYSTQAKSFLKRNTIFRNFLSAASVSLLGTHSFDFAIPLYVFQRTGSVLDLSLATVALHLPFFLMAPITGYSVDNLNKRKLMLGSDMGQILCLLFLFLYDFLPSSASIWPILLSVFVAKTLMIMFETVATFQLIPALVGRTDLSDANTWFLSSQRFIQILGPILAGLLFGRGGMRLCILTNCLSFGATLYFVFKMKGLNELIENEDDKKRKKDMTVGNIIDGFIESIKYVWNSPLFKPFIFMMFLWNASALNPYTASVTYYFTEVHKYSPEQYGLASALFGGIGMLGFMIAGPIYERFYFYNSFTKSALFLALTATLSLLFFQHPILFGIGFSISRAGGAVTSLGTFVLRQTHVPRAKMGSVNACLRMFFMSSTPVSSLLQGFLITHFGVGASFVVAALCLWATSWYAVLVAKAYEKLTAGQQKRAA